MIYRHRATITAVGNSASSVTLNVYPGLCQQFIVRANTSTTTFRAQIIDDSDFRIMDYATHTGEINDIDRKFAIAGSATIQLTDTSSNDTFAIYLAVREVR